MKTEKIISEIESLPVKDRAKIATAAMRSLNYLDPDVERAWVKEARRRLKEFDEGKVEGIPGEEVEQEIRKMLTK